MKKGKNTTEKINAQHWTDERWCPLFGAFPVSDISDRISEKCLAIIEDARCILGGFQFLPGLSNPDPARIEKSTGYPAAWILGARILVHEFDPDQILFDARFRQGNYQNGDGWQADRNGPYLLIDADQIDPARLNESIRIKAGLPHEFIIAFTDDTNKLPEKDDSAVITPAMTFALMAIAISWDLLQNIIDGTVQTKSTEARQQLYTAEKLLSRMHQLNARNLQDSFEKAEEKNPRAREKQRLYACKKHEKEKEILTPRNNELINAVKIILKGKKRIISTKEAYNELSKNKETRKFLTMKQRQFHSIIGQLLKEHKIKVNK